MKKIEAFVRPYQLESVQAALADFDITGMTVTEVKGMGHQTGHSEVFRGQTLEVNLLPKMKIEVIVDDEIANACAQSIMKSARTGKIGDGKILILPIDKVYRIRTGEQDSDATY